ncbi:hypothetical protein [Embleya sp. NPDC001921]
MTYDWDTHYFYSRYGFGFDFGPGRVTYDEIRAQHWAVHPPRCTCSLGCCTIHPAEPRPEPPTKPRVADIAVRAFLTAGP